MTLNKAVSELIDEMEKPSLPPEEVKALKKFQKWLFGIKGTVSNNTEYWHVGNPTEIGYYLLATKYMYKIMYWNGENWSDKNFPIIENDSIYAWHKIPECKK